MKAPNNMLHSPRMVLAAAALLLLLVIAVVSFRLTASPMPQASKDVAVPAPDVSVIEAAPASYRAHVSAYGATNPRYSLTLTAKVSGYVASLSPAFETGGKVAKGDMLLKLEDNDYRSALAGAEQDLASAQLELLEQQRQAVQARAEWNSAGLNGEPDSPLVLREPYVNAAKVTVNSAEAALASSHADFTHTTIIAPFNAVVIEQLVAPGSYVQNGAEIATLYSTDRVEVSLTLSANDWRKLPSAEDMIGKQWPVHLRNVDGSGQWIGRIARVEQHLDSNTRQRALIVAVDAPLEEVTPLLPGTFVAADIPGRDLFGLWRLPTSALSQRSEIWYINEDNALANFAAVPQFSDGDYIYMQPPTELAGAVQRVLTHPLSNYLNGMVVSPVTTVTNAVAAETQATDIQREVDNNG